MLNVSEAWKSSYPGAVAGALAVRDAANPSGHPALDKRKAELEAELRARYSDRASIAAMPVVQAYDAYYKRFKKTYHLQLQAESVALKGRSIPRVSALVEAMFVSELRNLLLTAGHDLAAITGPVALDVAAGTEHYTTLNGQEQTLKQGDMFMADVRGVISSVIYGPDQRTRIAPETRNVLYTVYAPPGIGSEAVRRHLEEIVASVALFSPQAWVESLNVYSA
jgi:DNA/RNA-binding domain of Phe-tRNA-synthetase-like protein